MKRTSSSSASNSNASNSSAASEARIAANVAQALAQVAGPAHAQPLVTLSERARSVERAALRLRDLLPSAEGGPNLAGTVPASASEPLVIAQPGNYMVMQLPPDVWQLIFTLLDETALGSIRQSCRRFYHAANGLPLNFLNPQSELGQKQRDICRKLLQSILNERPKPTRANPRPDYQPTIQRFKQALQAFASRYRCVEVQVLPGFERAVVEGLKEARCWQSLDLRFPSLFGDSADVKKLISQLGDALSVQQRTVALDLKVEMAPQSWPSQLSETVFTVTGLNVGEVDYDALPKAQPLKNLLSGPNALDYFEISGNPTPDPILPWLKTGSHNLTSLLLRDMPEDGQLLIDALGAKPKLSALTLENGSFAAGGLTLAQVLQAAPGLKSLSLTAVFFQVGGSAGCLQALRDSHLREIQFSACLLNADGAGEGLAELRETHQELLQGLREAPHLEVLKVTELDHSDRGQLALMLAGEFVLNPAAKTLCILDAGAESRFQELVVRANAQRAHQKLPPLELKTEATPAFEEEVDSDLMVELLRQFRSTGPLGPDGDDMGLDDLQDDEMNDDAPDDRRDDPNN